VESSASIPPQAASLDERLRRATPEERTSRAFLLIVDGPTAGRLHLLGDGDRVIGRGEDADIRIDDPLVSQEHARITRRADSYYLVDLGSRNGTLLNGERVREARMRTKDRVKIATTTVIFLEEERGEATKTIALHDDGRDAPSSRSFDARLYLDEPRALPPAGEENAAVELLRQAIKLGRFIWRNKWALIPLPLIGFALGVLSIFALPAPESAGAIVKLSHFEQDNPMEAPRATNRYAPKVFFEDPERNFQNRELVAKTFASMGAAGSAAMFGKAAAGLNIDTTEGGLYAATFSQPLVGKLPVSTVGFLEQYLDAYLVSEVDKQIRVFKSEASFLESELRKVEGELHDVEEELLNYRRAHIDSLPEQAGAAIAGQQELAMRRAELELEVERMAAQASNARARLSKPETTLARRYQDTRPLQGQIETLQREQDALKARGLTAEHPDVRKIATQIGVLEAQMNTKLSSGVSELEEKADPARIALREQAGAAESELRVAQKTLERVNTQLGAASGKVASVPEVEATVLRLTRRQDSLHGLRAQLFEQHRKSEVQIDLETANVRARYEVVAPAGLRDPITPKFLLQRLGGGFAVGLLLALIITAVGETRRLMKKHPELLRV
jgi:hypothetical protein